MFKKGFFLYFLSPLVFGWLLSKELSPSVDLVKQQCLSGALTTVYCPSHRFRRSPLLSVLQPPHTTSRETALQLVQPHQWKWHTTSRKKLLCNHPIQHLEKLLCNHTIQIQHLTSTNCSTECIIFSWGCTFPGNIFVPDNRMVTF